MDSNCGSADPPEAVGEKRPAENGGELGVPAAKKARSSGGTVENVRRVAEIVMVLAAMGKMRGGRSPTAAETEMMAEAREKLVVVCEEFAPKDVFPRDAFGAVMEDLGLNKLREQKLGFRPPKMSIAEKVLLTKQKMGKSEEFSLRTGTHSSQRLQTNLGAADKPIHAPIPSGGFQPASPLGHVSAANSASLPYQLPASEVRTTPGSSGLPSSLLGRDSSSTPLPRVDRPHFRLDPRSNGSITPQSQVNSSGNHTLLKTPAWSQQSQSTPSGKTGPDNKVLPHPSVKVEGTVSTNPSRVASQAAASKPVISQTTSGHLPAMHQHVQGMNFVQAPLLSNVHSEIGKIVQKLLQPQLPGRPTWTPPSRDYMNKALACQVCKLTISEVENVLVCDACEKGYHLKCLQSHNQKGVPRGEWHCFKCLALSNGKPLPPKYGRVTRNMTTPKVPSSTSAVQSSPEKKVGTLGEKGNQPKITANGSSGLQSAATNSMDNSNNHSAFDSNMQNAREVQGNDILSTGEKMGDKGHFEGYPNDAIRSSGPACVSSVACTSFEGSHEEILVSELKEQSSAKPSETSSETSDHLQASDNPQNNVQKELPDNAGIPLMQCHDNKLTVIDSEKSLGRKTFDGNPNADIKQEEQGVVRADPVEISGTSIRASDNPKSSSEVPNYVDWIGDVLKVVDEKIYYESCCINGVVYKVQDHALFCSNNDKVIPSKLQSMWEDNKTRSKCIIVNRCYFPGDLPEAVGRPCSPESNEVYESTHGITIMAGLIRGPCEVLPPSKFIEESERRSRLGTGINDGLRPVFLCK
ncbi:RING/FYVE/PHD zinc finger superfamily protein [Actinidia rufa]|uniref:RING/FYVE/PHD zinc finger superfamily protein n=1 Tax=Actinidia rufa TaxID=165716 RepID=A0A7J0G9B3_9ERIC|nr:RING/FYVE/PHD zinc finger superfamily protein [Actinidia rufa]